MAFLPNKTMRLEVAYLLTCANISVIVLRRSLRPEFRVDAWLPVVPARTLGRAASSEARPLVPKDRGRSVSEPDIRSLALEIELELERSFRVRALEGGAQLYANN